MKFRKRSIAGLVLVLLLTAVLFVNGKEQAILKIAGQKVSQEEYEMIMERQKSDIYNYFTSVYGVQPGDLAWDGNYEGKCPGDMLTERTVNKLMENHYVFCTAKQYGLTEDSSFEYFLKEWKKEDGRRKDAIKQGQVIAGPAELDMYEYYDYYLEELKGKVKQQLWQISGASSEDLHKLYEEQKDSHFRKEPEARAVRIFIEKEIVKESGKEQEKEQEKEKREEQGEEQEKKQEKEQGKEQGEEQEQEDEKLKLMQDIRLRLSQSKDVAKEIKKIESEGRCRVEEIELNLASRHHDESVYAELMEQVLSGKEGEITPVTNNSASYDIGIISEVNRESHYSYEEVKPAVEHDYMEELYKESQANWMRENNPG